jgi:hypothetical protein
MGFPARPSATLRARIVPKSAKTRPCLNMGLVLVVQEDAVVGNGLKLQATNPFAQLVILPTGGA